MSDSRAPRRWNTVLWALQIILAVAFVLAALSKITGVEASVAAFRALGVGDWFRYLVAGLEVAGAIGLLVPRLVGLAALCLAVLMVGAFLTQLLVVGDGIALPIPYLIASALLAWARRRRTAALWAVAAGRGVRS